MRRVHIKPGKLREATHPNIKSMGKKTSRYLGRNPKSHPIKIHQNCNGFGVFHIIQSFNVFHSIVEPSQSTLNDIGHEELQEVGILNMPHALKLYNFISTIIVADKGSVGDKIDQEAEEESVDGKQVAQFEKLALHNESIVRNQ